VTTNTDLHCLQLRKLAYTIKNSTTIVLPEWYRVLERQNMKKRMMPRDVSTRWNSTYIMLQFAIEYQTAIDEISANRHMKLRQYEMSKEEWEMAEQLAKVLKVCIILCSTFTY
jgi:hypothetical protein